MDDFKFKLKLFFQKENLIGIWRSFIYALPTLILVFVVIGFLGMYVVKKYYPKKWHEYSVRLGIEQKNSSKKKVIGGERIALLDRAMVEETFENVDKYNQKQKALSDAMREEFGLGSGRDVASSKCDNEQVLQYLKMINTRLDRIERRIANER